jgi:hypothetical protein
MSFGKSGAISSGVPSFLWDSIGSSTGLIYRSTGSFNITSYLGLSIDSGLARTILFGNSSNISTSLFSIRGDGNFDLYANTTVGSGSIFKLTSQNLIASAASFSHLGPMKVATYQSGTYALNISPTTGSLAGGILNETNVSTTSAFSFDDLTGYPILSGKPYGPISTAKHAETIFGSTGGLTGGTAGPYSYHVKRAEIVTRVTETVLASVYPAGLGFQFTYSNVFDLTTSNYYNSNVIIIKPTSYTAPGSPSVYIRVPASASQNLPPVYDTFKTNIYRIMLDDTGQFLEKYIAGIIFTFTATGGLISNSFLTAVEIPGNGCKYIDLHYLSYANPNNSNPRLFYRTCTGIGGYVDLANSATVGVQTSSVTTGISTGISTGIVTTSGTGNTFISQDFSNIGTGSKILCNLFYNQGYLPKEIWEADEKFGKLMLRTNKEGLFGYLTWARPIVNLLTKYPQYTKYFYLFSKPWTEHMAYKMGVLPKDNKLGKVIHYFGNKFSLIVYKLITSKKREKKK